MMLPMGRGSLTIIESTIQWLIYEDLHHVDRFTAKKALTHSLLDRPISFAVDLVTCLYLLHFFANSSFTAWLTKQVRRLSARGLILWKGRTLIRELLSESFNVNRKS